MLFEILEYTEPSRRGLNDFPPETQKIRPGAVTDLLLTFLMKNRGRWVSADEIIDFIYSGFEDGSPEDAIGVVRSLIYRLRKNGYDIDTGKMGMGNRGYKFNNEPAPQKEPELDPQDIADALAPSGGKNVRKAASILGISREVLLNWLEKNATKSGLIREPVWAIREAIEINEMKISPEKVTLALQPSKGEDLQQAAENLGISVDQLVKWLNLHTDKLGPESGREVVKYPDGTQFWYVNSLFHRDGGLPAVTYDDGSQFWRVNGERHRGGGLPAIIRADGSQEWYVNDKRHRENGPAVIRADGAQEWFKNGKQVHPPKDYQD